MAIPTLLLSSIAWGHENDDPLLTKVMIDQLEMRNSDSANPAILEAQAWVGHDLNKVWLKANLAQYSEKTTDTAAFDNGNRSELQILYSHAIAAFWDLQAGLRQDIKPTPTRTWGTIGIRGISPYFLDVDAAFFIDQSGHTAARLSVSYDLLFTQALILSPAIEINLYGTNDIAAGVGSGLSDTKTGLRLRYEIQREFAPYIGINWNNKLGTTSKIAQFNNKPIRETEWLTGLRIWF